MVLFELADKEIPSQAQINLLRAEMLRIGHNPKTVNTYINKLMQRDKNGNS